MRKLLSWWAQKAFVNKWLVLSFWILALAVGGFFAWQYAKPTSSEISIPGTEAQKTLSRYNELFTDTGKGSSRVVLASSQGKALSDYAETIDSLVADLSKSEGVMEVYSPLSTPGAISGDGTIGFVTVQLNEGLGSVSEATRDEVFSAIDKARDSGLQVEVSGDLINQAPSDILGVGEIAGVVIALIVLVVTLGSLVAAGLPIIVAIVTVAGSMAGLFSLSQIIDINSTTPVLAIMLGLAVGIDYSLFIINRYKTLLLEGKGYKDAISEALASAGSAVLYAAATVIIALSALVVVNIPFLTSMGLAAAATVALAALIAVTLMPALLGMVRSYVFTGKTRREIVEAQKRGYYHTEHVSHDTFWFKWGQALTNHPVIITISAVLLAGVIAIPALDLKMSLPFDEYANTETTQRKAYDLITKGFGVGYNAPLVMVVENMPEATEADKQAVQAQFLEQWQKEMAAKYPTADIIMTSEGMAQLQAQAEQYVKYSQIQKISERINGTTGVAQASPGLVNDDGTNGVIQIIPSTAPGDQATTDLINYLRDSDNQSELVGNTDAEVGITGATALMLDVNKRLSDALPTYLGVVVGLSFLLLVVAFRSILIPIKAALGFLLSVSAMFGALVAVYQWGWLGLADAPGPIVSFIPIIAIGILFGLAMDYEFFLVSSMHDAHLHTKDARKAVYRGFSVGAKVVTAAGVIMISVFAGFISNHDTTIQALGFALAFGILIDAFLVRMTLVPAVMTLLGNAAWWPFSGKKSK